MTTQSRVRVKPRQARVGHHQTGHAVGCVAPRVPRRTTTEDAVSCYLAAQSLDSTIDLMRKNHLAGGKDLASMAIGAFSETANEGVGFGLGFAMTLGEVEAGTLGAGDYYWGGAASTISIAG